MMAPTWPYVRIFSITERYKTPSLIRSLILFMVLFGFGRAVPTSFSEVTASAYLRLHSGWMLQGLECKTRLAGGPVISEGQLGPEASTSALRGLRKSNTYQISKGMVLFSVWSFQKREVEEYIRF